MSAASRIPKYESPEQWCRAMMEAELDFHPEDDPADIVRAKGSEPLFTAEEVVEVRACINKLFNDHNDPCAIVCALLEERDGTQV